MRQQKIFHVSINLSNFLDHKINGIYYLINLYHIPHSPSSALDKWYETFLKVGI